MIFEKELGDFLVKNRQKTPLGDFKRIILYILGLTSKV